MGYGKLVANGSSNFLRLSSQWIISSLKPITPFSLIKRTTSSSFTALLVYVDHVILCGNDVGKINSVKVALDSSFKIKDLGDLKYFFGFEIIRSSTGISICQRKYTRELLEDARCLACKLASTPMSSNIKLTKDDGDPYEDVSHYCRLIGRLIYLTNTCPDICFAVHHLSQFLS